MLNAFVESCTSIKDKISETIKATKLVPKTIFAQKLSSIYMRNMVITASKKLTIATACIFFIMVNRLLNFLTCKSTVSDAFSSYLPCKLLIKAAIARYLALYASIVKEIAGKSSAGMLSVSSTNEVLSKMKSSVQINCKFSFYFRK